MSESLIQDETEEVIIAIKQTLEKIRPFIQSDGGDVQFVAYKDGIVYVSMLGACASCMMLDETMKEGIETILMEEIPQVTAVRLA